MSDSLEVSMNACSPSIFILQYSAAYMIHMYKVVTSDTIMMQCYIRIAQFYIYTYTRHSLFAQAMHMKSSRENTTTNV